jgi:hypothetical protein
LKHTARTRRESKPHSIKISLKRWPPSYFFTIFARIMGLGLLPHCP